MAQAQGPRTGSRSHDRRPWYLLSFHAAALTVGFMIIYGRRTAGYVNVCVCVYQTDSRHPHAHTRQFTRCRGCPAINQVWMTPPPPPCLFRLCVCVLTRRVYGEADLISCFYCGYCCCCATITKGLCYCSPSPAPLLGVVSTTPAFGSYRCSRTAVKCV